MYWSSINISNFRNFKEIALSFCENCNIIYGNNGTGKTSILEAIYYLVFGRSFRAYFLNKIIKHNTDHMIIFGKLYNENRIIPIGTKRSINGYKDIKFFGNSLISHMEITKMVPIQLLNHESYSLLSGGPINRRKFINWGLFYTEYTFLNLWRKIKRIIIQRNTAIKNKLSFTDITTWDITLSQLGNQLHLYRKQYINELMGIIQNILFKLKFEFTVDISYNPGWDESIDLYQLLLNNINIDCKYGYTTQGPHRADLSVLIEKVSVKDMLSYGQQKLLVYGLQIAQGVFLDKKTGKKCIYLLDDILAEFDKYKKMDIANLLLSLNNNQLFVTGTNYDELKNYFSLFSTVRDINLNKI